MKLKLHILVFCFPFITMMAQVNLVSNGDFETISQCPTNYSQINYALGWSSPTLGTPDLLCLCNSSLNSTNSVFGYQAPHSGNNCVAATYIDLNTPHLLQISESIFKINLSVL